MWRPERSRRDPYSGNPLADTSEPVDPPVARTNAERSPSLSLVDLRGNEIDGHTDVAIDLATQRASGDPQRERENWIASLRIPASQSP